MYCVFLFAEWCWKKNIQCSLSLWSITRGTAALQTGGIRSQLKWRSYAPVSPNSPNDALEIVRTRIIHLSVKGWIILWERWFAMSGFQTGKGNRAYSCFAPLNDKGVHNVVDRLICPSARSQAGRRIDYLLGKSNEICLQILGSPPLVLPQLERLRRFISPLPIWVLFGLCPWIMVHSVSFWWMVTLEWNALSQSP